MITLLSGATFARLASVVADTGAGGAMPPLDTSGADCLVVNAAVYGTALGVTDSMGNAWVALPAIGGGGLTSVRQYYCLSPTNSAALVVTFGNQHVAGEVIAYQGVLGFDQQQQVVAPANTTSYSYNAFTPSQTDSLLVAALSTHYYSAAASIDSDYGAVTFKHASGYKTLNAADRTMGAPQQIAPTWTIPGAQAMALSHATFAINAGGAPPTFKPAWAAASGIPYQFGR